jgi:hypothetical protein
MITQVKDVFKKAVSHVTQYNEMEELPTPEVIFSGQSQDPADTIANTLTSLLTTTESLLDQGQITEDEAKDATIAGRALFEKITSERRGNQNAFWIASSNITKLAELENRLEIKPVITTASTPASQKTTLETLN